MLSSDTSSMWTVAGSAMPVGCTAMAGETIIPGWLRALSTRKAIELLGHPALVVYAEAGVHARHDDAVLQLHGAYPEGLEEVSQLLQGHAPYSWSTT